MHGDLWDRDDCEQLGLEIAIIADGSVVAAAGHKMGRPRMTFGPYQPPHHRRRGSRSVAGTDPRGPISICGERVKALGSRSTALRARREVLAQELEEADLAAPTTEELSALGDRVAEQPPVTLSRSRSVQSLIPENPVDGREAIHPIFRVPVVANLYEDDAVRAPSQSVEAKV